MNIKPVAVSGKPNPDRRRILRRFPVILPCLLWVPLAIYYAIGICGVLYEPFHQRSLEIMNSGPAVSTSETDFIEHLEAAYWLIAFSVFTAALIKRKYGKAGAIWVILFTLICFAALGEETSWGQHYLKYSTPGTLHELNVQDEFNVHNLDIGKILNLPENSVVYQFGSVSTLLNYTFYLVCVLLWLVMPLALRFTKCFKNSNLLRNYPRQNVPFLIIYGVSVAVFLLVDLSMFDAGELFELTHATAGCATAFIHVKWVNSHS